MIDTYTVQHEFNTLLWGWTRDVSVSLHITHYSTSYFQSCVIRKIYLSKFSTNASSQYGQQM